MPQGVVHAERNHRKAGLYLKASKADYAGMCALDACLPAELPGGAVRASSYTLALGFYSPRNLRIAHVCCLCVEVSKDRVDGSRDSLPALKKTDFKMVGNASCLLSGFLQR